MLVSLVLCAVLLPLNASAQKAAHPLSKDTVVKFLKGDVSPHRVAAIARERGIDFQVTADIESELRQAGATDELISTLREVAPKPAQIVVETSPGAQIYLDDAFKGQASSEGRLVIANAAAGEHTLRVSLAGKKDYEKPVTVVAGQVANIQATLADVEPPRPSVGSVRENPKDGLKYVWIPPGTFMMGCSSGDADCGDSEKPSHPVTISKGFWMGQTEVTVRAYKRFASVTGRLMPAAAPKSNPDWANEQMPIVNVSWADAQGFCQWAGGRLPTEAEWEYAARGGSTEPRYGPLDEIAWYNENSGGIVTHEVAKKRPNTSGLYDVLGNVFEWVGDWYDPHYYRTSPTSDPSGPPTGQSRVARGGVWNYAPGLDRVSNRHWLPPATSIGVLGFRCVGEVGNP
jgi:formylglycine-generating enzyme required for sulfatase activity